MNKEKELREYLKSKTKEEIIDLYIQDTFETNLMIEDLQKDIEHLTNATNYYYDENNKLKGCVKMSKYWYVEDGQVCWRTPYADLRGCDYTMLVACLNERDEKIADLKKQLADVKNSCDYYMKRSNDLVLKLAEKDKLISVYADEHGMLQCKIADLVVKEIKTEDIPITYVYGGNLEECHKVISDLEAKLAESERQHQEYRQIVEKDIKKEIDERMRDTIKEFNFDISQLKQQLEEKDKRIRKLNLEAQKYFEDAYCNDFQTKTKTDFAIKQLEKVKYDFFDVSNGWWLCFKDGTQYMTHRELEGCLREVIDNQIKELKGENK